MKWFGLTCKWFLHSILLSLVFADAQLNPFEDLMAWDDIQERIEQEMDVNNFADLLAIYGDAHPYLQTDMTQTNMTNIVEAFNLNIKTLTDRHSIREGVLQFHKDLKLPSTKDAAVHLRSAEPSPLCTDENGRNGDKEELVFSAIVRALNFYGAQIDKINRADTALGLMLLKEIDDKHGKIFQRQFPLADWIQQNCAFTGQRNAEEGEFCKTLARQWRSINGGTGSLSQTSTNGSWKHSSHLQQQLNQTEQEELEMIGQEKEGMWGPLNGQCQAALVNRCEIPYVCERTLLDPVPRSQYLLTHQLLHRMLIDRMDCPSIHKSFVTKEETYDSLCAKTYMEAKYLDLLDTPIVFRDLFAEQIGLCGHMGYSNFLRADWLDKILSWQSKSDNGCFVKDPFSPFGLITTDVTIQRLATKTEVEHGWEPTEKCMPHFTAVSVMALSAYWDFLKDNCVAN